MATERVIAERRRPLLIRSSRWNVAADANTVSALMESGMRMTALVPMLQTNDMMQTRKWYEEVLGFRCVSAQDDGWCRLERDEIAIMFMRNAHLGTPARNSDAVHLRRRCR
jgi:hypothetical protein